MKPIGYSLQVLPSIDSTNNYAMGLIQQGLAAHGMGVFAMDQFAGKGQRGKSWNSNPGENIAVSIIYENIPLSIDKQFLFSASIALAVYDFFSSFAGDETTIKWPNDIFWRDRKSAGILIENKISADLNRWNWAVVGIGININQVVFGETNTPPVSLKQLTGKEWDVLNLTKILCQHLQNRWIWMQKTTAEGILEAYNRELFKRNHTVRLVYQNQIIEAKISHVDEHGILHANVNENSLSFKMGDITWLI